MRALRVVENLDRVPEVLRCRRHTHDWLKLTASYVGVNARLPFAIRLPSGRFEFRERGDVATFWQIFYRDVYPVGKDYRLVVDAGANIGAFSLFALTQAPEARLIAIEPAPDSCQRIRALLEEHGVAQRCTLYETALGANQGETTIQLNAGSQFRRTGVAGHAVSMRTLESLIPPDATVDLLKIDVEGAEYDIVATAGNRLLHRIERIIMEYHPVAPAENAVNPLLQSGFRVTRRQDDGAGYGLIWLTRKPG